MPYDYNEEKQAIFTEDGQRVFLKIRDNVNRLIKDAGSVTMGSAVSAASGDGWFLMACVDRMVELGELREVRQAEAVAGQNRIFVKA